MIFRGRCKSPDIDFVAEALCCMAHRVYPELSVAIHEPDP